MTMPRTLPSTSEAVVATTPAATQVQYAFQGCFSGHKMVRPYGDVPSTMMGVKQCRDACHDGGYTYFGMECPHDDGAEVHCQCSSGVQGTLHGESDCNGGLIQNHCTGPFVVSDSRTTYYLGAAHRGAIYSTGEVEAFSSTTGAEAMQATEAPTVSAGTESPLLSSSAMSTLPPSGDMTMQRTLPSTSEAVVATTPAATQVQYAFQGCFSGHKMVRPYGDVPSTMMGVKQCRDACHDGGYAYFGMECPHDDGAEVHCQCSSGVQGTLHGESDCNGGLIQNHCTGPFIVS